jgi:hypothetical protein
LHIEFIILPCSKYCIITVAGLWKMGWAGGVELGMGSGKIRIQFWLENLKIASNL